ncbi:hypothetical protein [Nocardia niwae]|uniref:hypothetical protein n=1 Tax=Nocardia niwae TaxID=626084 RepID=UPI0012F507F9|nr:hypothetical protein [Nocardia niwae]
MKISDHRAQYDRIDVSRHVERLGPPPPRIRESIIATFVAYYRQHPDRIPGARTD